MLVPLCCGALDAIVAAAGPALAVGAVFVPLLMLPVSVVVLVGLGWAHTAILRATTGRRRTWLAVVLTLLVPVGVGVVVLAQGEIPLEPVHGVPLPLGIGIAAAGISTLALPRWAKLVGVLTALILAVLVTSGSIHQDAAAHDRRDAELAARFDRLLHGATTDLPGAETTLVQFTDSVVDVRVELDDRELLIRNSWQDSPGGVDTDTFACWLLTGAESTAAGQTYEDFADRCRIGDDGGWVTSDGLAFGTFHHGDWIAVVAGDAATAEDVAAVAGTLVDLPPEVRRPYWDDLLYGD